MKIILRSIMATMGLMLLIGCGNPFKKPGDEPVKSSCDACQKSPFYVDGKWIKP